MNSRHASLLFPVVSLVVACSAEATSSGETTGGRASSSAGGSSSFGGSPGSGGTSTSGGSVTSGGFVAAASGGLSATGGSAGSGGLLSAMGGSGTSAGGNNSGGTIAGGNNSGGAGTAGASGAASSGGVFAGGQGGGAGGSSTGGIPGSGGASATAKPSAGCGKSGRPSGGSVTVANHHIYTFPSSYDGTKPFPLLMGFHAAGNPIDQIRTLTNGSDFEKNYVRAFGKSAGSAWVYGTDIAKVIAIYDELMSNYCIDTSRVFATGHSSGAQMIVQILTKASDASHFGFKAVAPVAASNYGAIAAPIPVLYIQGAKDSERSSNGADVVAQFTKVNQCSTTTQAYTGAPACTSSGTNVNAGCVSYQGCAKPTIWCSHNDPAYSGTSHGVPCFAVRTMVDFFEGLPGVAP